MKLLIDTNVILDMIFKRNGRNNAMDLFKKVKETGVSAYNGIFRDRYFLYHS